VSERIWTNSAENAPEMSPEAAASPERDLLVRNSPEILNAAQSHQINPDHEREMSEVVGRAAIAGQQRDQLEQRQQDLAPSIGRTALAAQRREETQEAVTRQLGYKAVERARIQNRN
jgi:hypothetical protein